MTRRAHALALLASIHDKLTAGTVINLNDEERRYLTAACADALAARADPLGIAKPVGGQDKPAETIAEAMLVHRRRKELGTIRAACESVGAEFNRDGGKSGAVEKNYKRHRAALDAADRIYSARRTGQTIDDTDVMTVLTRR